MRFFQHTILLKQVYISGEDYLVWRWTMPDRTPTRTCNIHLYCRLAPDQAKPEQECGIEPLSFEVFQAFLEEISFQQAYRHDPRLVDYVSRLVAYPNLPLILRQIPRRSLLRLVSSATSPTEEFFEVFLVATPETALSAPLPLNPLLEPLLPWKEIGGTKYLAVPCPNHLGLASRVLILALERCLYGVHTSPVYSYLSGLDRAELGEA